MDLTSAPGPFALSLKNMLIGRVLLRSDTF